MSPVKWALAVMFTAMIVLAVMYMSASQTSSDNTAHDGTEAQNVLVQTDQQVPAAQAEPIAIKATYSCDLHKSVTAIFTQRQVQLTLSDGRTLTLPQAMSASGARYANQDESFVFWNKGNNAFIDENGEHAYVNCVTPANE